MPPAAVEDLQKEIRRLRVESSRQKARIRDLEFELSQEREIRVREHADLERRRLELNRLNEDLDRRKARLDHEEKALRTARQKHETQQGWEYTFGPSEPAGKQMTPEQRAEEYREQQYKRLSVDVGGILF